MNICLLIGEFSIFSGTTKPMYELAKGLSNEGHHVKIVTTKLKASVRKKHELSLENDKCNLEILEIGSSLYKYFLFDYKSYNKHVLDTLIEADIIHGFNFLELFLAKRALSKLNTKSKFICSSTGPFSFHLRDFIDSGLISFLNLTKFQFIFKLFMPNYFFKKIFNSFDKIISSSEYMAREVSSIGIDPEKIKTLPVIMDKIQIGHQIDLNRKEVSKKYDFIYYGSGSSIRGVSDVLKAFEMVLEKRDSTLAFYFLGSHGVEEKIYEYLIKSHKNFGSSIFLSSGIDLNILDRVKSSNAVILPFRSPIGFSHPPLTVLEGMALEKPVISTYVGSIPESINDGSTGFLVRKGDFEKIAEKMLLTYDDDLNHEIGKQARNKVLETHGTEKIVNETINIYNELICNVED